ncbi:MAG: hypothetical protein ACO3UU_07880 [Minisyncoccia bacterium]
MAERPLNIFKRQLISFNPNFRIDTANPQMGLSGTDVYKIYGVTDNRDTQSSISLSSTGLFEVSNDRTIQIAAGAKNNQGSEDIVITGLNGNISISATKGMIRIHAKNIMLEADEDIHLKAGRNINLKAGSGRLMLDSAAVDTTALTGNLATLLSTDFLTKVFTGSIVENVLGLDGISQLVGDAVLGGTLDSVVNTLVPF